jgi:hypothetical protein
VEATKSRWSAGKSTRRTPQAAGGGVLEMIG